MLQIRLQRRSSFCSRPSFIGYGMAGLLRKWLVYPPQMVWPSVLPTIALLDTLHADKEKSNKRTRFFFIVFAAVFIYG